MEEKPYTTLTEKVHIKKSTEKIWSVALKWYLGSYILSLEGGWNWSRTLPSGREGVMHLIYEILICKQANAALCMAQICVLEVPNLNYS
jgi:hypothetical protein